MNTIATFDNTVGILVKAYLDGTLAAGYCQACAVGNMCAAALGTKVFKTERNGPIWQWADGAEQWSQVFYTGIGAQNQTPDCYDGIAKEQIDATGYTWQQLARIEYAFEKAVNWRKEDNDETRFTRLMAVVDVLADIHGIDLATAEVAKGLFVKEQMVTVGPIDYQVQGHCTPIG